MRCQIRVIDSHVFYLPRPGEDTSNLFATVCEGHCLEPQICEGDYLVLDRKLKPRLGNYVCYKGIGYQFLLDKDGKPLLKNGHSTVKPEDENYDGVIVQINRKLGGLK